MYSYDSKKNNMFNVIFRFKCFVCNKEIQKKKLSSSQISRTNININVENEIDLDVLFQNLTLKTKTSREMKIMKIQIKTMKSMKSMKSMETTKMMKTNVLKL